MSEHYEYGDQVVRGKTRAELDAGFAEFKKGLPAPSAGKGAQGPGEADIHLAEDILRLKMTMAGRMYLAEKLAGYRQSAAAAAVEEARKEGAESQLASFKIRERALEQAHASAVAELEEMKQWKAQLYLRLDERMDIFFGDRAGSYVSRDQLTTALRERDEARAEAVEIAGKLHDAVLELTATKAALAEMTARKEIAMASSAQQKDRGDKLLDRLAAKQQECVELREQAAMDTVRFKEMQETGLKLEADLDYARECGDISKHAAVRFEAQLTAEQLAHENTKAELFSTSERSAGYAHKVAAANQRAADAEALADRMAETLKRALEDFVRVDYPGAAHRCKTMLNDLAAYRAARPATSGTAMEGKT